MPNAERYKAEVLTSLGYTYLSAPSEDRINHLKLAQWYFKKAKNRYLKISGSYPQRYIETSLAEIEDELGSNSTRIIKPKNHNIWWADFSGLKEE